MKLQTVLASSALFLSAAAAQAAVLPLTVDINGTTSGADSGTTVGAGFGGLDTATFDLTWTATSTITSGYTNGTVTSQTTFNLLSGVGTTTVTNCVNNGGTLIDLCTQIALNTPAATNLVVGSAPQQLPIILIDSSTVNSPVGDIFANTTYTFNLPAPEVPVPAAAWLFGSALVGLAGVGRKRK